MLDVPILEPVPRQEQPWFVVNTQPHRECLAVHNLSAQHFVSYNPMVQKTVRHARRTSHVRRPLFPSYVFVKLDDQSERWRSMLSTIGVRTVVRFGDCPALIGNAFIERLREREQAGVIVRPSMPYRVGQSVKIVQGSLDGLVATIVEVGESDRIGLLLNLLGRSARLMVEPGAIREVANTSRLGEPSLS